MVDKIITFLKDPRLLNPTFFKEANTELQCFRRGAELTEGGESAVIQ